MTPLGQCIEGPAPAPRRKLETLADIVENARMLALARLVAARGCLDEVEAIDAGFGPDEIAAYREGMQQAGAVIEDARHPTPSLCPFCGAGTMAIERGFHPAVFCQCGARGPAAWGENAAGAVALWNRRSPCVDTSAARGRRIDELLEANNRYQQEARDARADSKAWERAANAAAADVGKLVEEAKALRQIIVDSANALYGTAIVSPDVSTEFLRHIPSEVRLRIAALQDRQAPPPAPAVERSNLIVAATDAMSALRPVADHTRSLSERWQGPCVMLISSAECRSALEAYERLVTIFGPEARFRWLDRADIIDNNAVIALYGYSEMPPSTSAWPATARNPKPRGFAASETRTDSMGRTAEGKANQRKASAEYHRRLREAGFKKMQVWVAPASRVDLARLTTHHGSQQAAIIAALAIAAAALPPTTKS